MNEFDKKIAHNRQQHNRLVMMGGALLLLISLMVVLGLFYSHGYTVNVQPEQARLNRSFSTQQGVGIFLDDKLYTFTEDFQFVTEAKNYLPHKTIIGKNSNQIINIKLIPKPSRITASTVPMDNDTTWYLNNELVFVGSKLDLEVKPGSHSLKIDSPFQLPLSENFEIKIAQQINRELKLKPITGLLKLASKPVAAKGFVDGEFVGNTPLTLERNGGRYKIRIELEGYESIEDVITVTNKSLHPSREYQLLPKNFYLRFLLQPQTGDLLIDGKLITDTQRVAITANQQHHISYQKAGYFSYSQVIKLSDSIEKNLQITLQPELATVEFKATPLALVTVDGKLLGKTPIIVKLLSLPHKIEFNKKGYRKIVKNIEPRANFKTVVKVSLLTEYEARRKEGRVSAAKKIGIEMVEFKPKTLMMGSKVNEKGRRRNEFLSDVKFTRPILVSRHEITESQYSKFRKGKAASKLPVSNISWLEAVQFCNWLSQQEGLSKFYRIRNGRYAGINVIGNGYRLPTEAEWEWLARKANRVSETVFVWGDSDKIPEKIANLADESVKSKNVFTLKNYQDGFAGKAPVGSFNADALSLYDLAGNLSEWVHDYYSAIPPAQTHRIRDPLGPDSGRRHFYKGANYNSGRVTELRGAYREPASAKLPTVGFRIVRYR